MSDSSSTRAFMENNKGMRRFFPLFIWNSDDRDFLHSLFRQLVTRSPRRAPLQHWVRVRMVTSVAKTWACRSGCPQVCCRPLQLVKVAWHEYFHSKRHESDSRISSHHARRFALAAVELDENSKRGLSGADRQRESGRATVAIAAQKREHAAQAHSVGGVLFCPARHGSHARRR